MTTMKRIAKNTSSLFLAQILSYIIGFFTLAYSARYLGVENFGILSFALAFAGIFGVFSDLGLRTLVVREVARDKSLTEKYIGNSLSIKILLAFITLFLIFITLNIWGYDIKTSIVVYLISISVIIASFSQFFYSIFQAYEKMEFQGISVFLNAVFVFLGILTVIYLNSNVVGFSFVYILAAILVLIFNLIICLKKFSLPGLLLDHEFWKVSIKEALPFAITGISINIYTWIDTIILAFLKGSEVVGYYTAAYRLVIVLLVIPVIVNTVVFPLMSRYHVSSKDNLKYSFEKLFKFMALIGIPLGVGTIIVAEKVILLVYGTEYIPSVIALQILVWSLVMIFLRSPFERLLEASNKQFSVTKIFFIGAIFNIVLNLIFIPIYSYVGAAIITVLTDILVLIILIHVTRDIGYKISLNAKLDLIKIIVSSLIMGIILIFFINQNLFIIVLIGILIYVALLHVLRVFDAEFSMIKSMLK